MGKEEGVVGDHTLTTQLLAGAATVATQVYMSKLIKASQTVS